MESGGVAGEVKYAGVQFLDDPRVKKAIPIERIREAKRKTVFSPSCVEDVPAEPVSVKWQASDLASDGYFPAKVLCLAATAEGAIEAAKHLGHKLSVMEVPARRKMDSPKVKEERKARSKRAADVTLVALSQRKKAKKSGHKSRDIAASPKVAKSKKEKKKISVNRLAANPVTAARLKESMAAALNSNPIFFNLQQNQDSIEGSPLQTKEHRLTLREKPSPVKIDKKPSPVKIDKEPSPVKIDKEPSPVKIDKKPSPVKSKKDDSPLKMDKKTSFWETYQNQSPLKFKSPSKMQVKVESFSPVEASSSKAKVATPQTPVILIEQDGSSLDSTMEVDPDPLDEDSDNLKTDCFDGDGKENTSGDESSSSEQESNDSSASASASNNSSSSEEDSVCPVSKLSDKNSKLEEDLRSLKVENKDLKTQLSVVWSTHKSKVEGLQEEMKVLESKVKNLKEDLSKEKERNGCLQDALVKSSKSSSVARVLNFKDHKDSKDKKDHKDSKDKKDHKDSKKDHKEKSKDNSQSKNLKSALKSPSKRNGSDSQRVKEEPDFLDLSAVDQKEIMSGSEDNCPIEKSSSVKKKSGKKYIESHASEIDNFCQQILAFLNKTEHATPDSKGNIDIGGVTLNYKKMMEILKTDKGGPESIARNLTLLVWGSNQMIHRSLDGKSSNRYPNAPRKEPATPSKVNAILGAVKASLLKGGSSEGPAITTTLQTCRRSIGNKFNEAATKVKKSPS